MNEDAVSGTTQEEPEHAMLVSPSQSITPRPPDGLTEETKGKINAEVASLAALIERSLNNRNFMMTLENLGESEQTLANQRIELIETRVNAITKQETKGADIPATVTAMRSAIDKLNPRRAEGSLTGKILQKIPGGRMILEAWWASGLRQIALRRETIRDQIKGVKTGLQGNRTQLIEDNKQLNVLYEYVVKGALSGLQRSAYTCELLLAELRAAFNGMAPDGEQRGKLQGAMEKITVRIGHMRQLENALQQGLATIDITIDGNGKIAESLEETATLTTAYLTVAMALYQALAHQQKAVQALVKARSGTAEVMIKTSEMARQSAETVSQLYYDPSVGLAQVEMAQSNLMSALKTLEDASRNGMVDAQQSIEKLSNMTQALRDKQGRLRATRHLTETSVQ